jgi:DNA-binding NtrC family response regulator
VDPNNVPRLAMVYASLAHNLKLCNALRANGWSVELVSSPGELLRLLRRPGVPHAGLIELSEHGVIDANDAIERCLGLLLQIHWVAAAQPGVLRKPAIRELIASYCVDFVRMPYDPEIVQRSLDSAHRMASLFGPLPHAMETAADAPMVGRSEAMQRLARGVRKVAQTDAALFIIGESGTGKELVAQQVHQLSSRKHAPFVSLSCGAVPTQLLQSELFGYERGAFTGADRSKAGKVEAANGGTLFLDEVGDLPMECQASLLRFAQEGTIQRLGSDETLPLDVRIVSSTHVDMKTAIADGSFRFDLYLRLCVLHLDVPALRDRGGDISLLANHILTQHAPERGRKIYGFTPSAVRAMQGYAWPGNVRELTNRIRRAIVMAEGRYISARDLDLAETLQHKPVKLAEARDDAERNCLLQALTAHGNRVGEIAEELGVSRTTLYRLRVRHGLNDSPDGDVFL